MPWRVGPADKKQGIAPDPYRVWLSEIMLQQTTVAAVKDYFIKFVTRWPTVSDLANAEDAEVMAAWAGLGYYARARNLLKCARVVTQDHDGIFPKDEEALRALPGIGPYTTAAIGSIAFDLPLTVVDGNVERVMARLYDEHTPLPAAKPVLTAYADEHTPQTRPGDYAQAVMDLGATICTPRNPVCGLCPVRPQCRAHAAGTATELPKKTPKKPKPTRHGIAYVTRRDDGAWLLETRPEKGLLGGMLGWPGGDWIENTTPLPMPNPPCPAEWAVVPGTVRHTFTHFHLELTLYAARVPNSTQSDAGKFMTQSAFKPADLPTVMRKAFDLAKSTLNET
ncbi:MAG: A/G-specific adenine glycosylase [Rhodobacteraceae bacterium]|nr:A/G-specific adenine glycosylase [Paracoccaceae bacterium]